MPIYITLCKLTREGVTKIKESPQRAEKAREIKSVGAEIKEIYYTSGQYDVVVIAEAPNNEAIMKALFMIGSIGAVRQETLVAIPAEKVEIIKQLS